MYDLIFMLLISVAFIIIFGFAEILYRKNIDVEITRKLTHFAGTAVTLFFPFVFKSHWAVLVLGLIFAIVMVFTKKFGLLQFVHGVQRKSEGAVYQPIAIYLCFIYSQLLAQPWFYVIAISILAISDASAALIGKNYGTNEYIVEIGTRKTLEGSVSFFLTSFIITHLVLLLATSIGRIESVLVALLISIIATIFEGVSLKGADNLFIPLAVMFILSKNISPAIPGILFQLLVLTVFFIGYFVLMFPYKRIGVSGVLLIALISYVVWALLGNVYAGIVLAFSLVCAKTNWILTHDCDVADSYRVKPVFYILAIPVVCAFLGEYFANIIIYPFVVSIVSEGIIIRTGMFGKSLNKGLFMTSVLSLIILGAAYVFVG